MRTHENPLPLDKCFRDCNVGARVRRKRGSWFWSNPSSALIPMVLTLKCWDWRTSERARNSIDQLRQGRGDRTTAVTMVCVCNYCSVLYLPQGIVCSVPLLYN